MLLSIHVHECNSVCGKNKHKCTGSTAYLYFGDRELVKKIGLKPAWKKPLSNGGLDGVLARYERY